LKLLPDLAERIGGGGELEETLKKLGRRPRKAKLRSFIHAFCTGDEWQSPEKLACLLKCDKGNLVRRHLTPMTDQGLLERKHPHNPHHPKQAYRTADRLEYSS